MRRMQEIHIEDAVTARMKLRYPKIRRIGVKRYAEGWRCYRALMVKGAPIPSYEQTDALLAEANTILAEITAKHEIAASGRLN
jgi:hypothetical protein